MNKGQFIKFNLPYLIDSAVVSSLSQAKEVLIKTETLLANGAKGVGITYSANYGQTREIEKTYFAGGWNTKTSGANQAGVIREMESLLESQYQSLQGKIHILPITTMNACEKPVNPWNEDIHMGIVVTDLNRIKTYLECNWNVLGWQNQETVDNAQYPFAVGGGVATLPPAISNKIQSTLKEHSSSYGS